MSPAPLKVANCSGFYGDRLSAAAEMVEGGPIDVLTGDWLAELTMLILAKNRMRDPAAGYARSFLTQMEQVMGTCLDRGIKVVSNAGGLAPARLAERVEELADRLGLAPAVAYIEGDDLMGRLAELREAGCDFANLDTGEPLADRDVVTANAYLGGFGIAEALGQGADIVVTGRVTDAALALGPAAWHHGWRRDDWDALAGAVVAGHVIECGAQATGGNFSFFEEVPGLEHVGFPIAEIAGDGSSVITKHPGHGGLVSVETVTAQLLYEIASPRYANPDVTARFDTIELSQEGPDRVRISGVRGEPPPTTTKVAMNYLGGHRTTLTMILTGLDVETKAAAFERALWASVPGGKESFAAVEVDLLRTDQEDPPTNEAAMAQLRITVKDPDERKVGRAFSAKVTELALASYPGLFGAGSATQAYGVYWPAAVPAELVWQEVVVNGKRHLVEPLPPSTAAAGAPPASAGGVAAFEGGETAPLPLGRIAGARSGDKGGNANLGVFARTDRSFRWLSWWLTVERLRDLLPEARPLRVERFDLPNLRALNFVLYGLLGEGVAASSRIDGQAKGLGEYLRAKVVPVPRELHP
ncbi:MAG TPA: acyclic terpene utilization AtuA family protein [Acidimicrobiales bacterium]|nr:acyclic terpene utilization AtuA family protein [Acidimicrobiales bacterium]